MRRILFIWFGIIAGCAAGSRAVTPTTIESEDGWTTVRGVPLVEQKGEYDCGAAAAAMVLRYWGQSTTSDELWTAAGPKQFHGVTAGWVRDELKKRGLEAYLFKGTLTDLYREVGAGHPVIVGVAKDSGNDAVTHYEVVVGLHAKRRAVLTLDPAKGMREFTVDQFLTEWSRSSHLMVAAFPPGQKPPA